MKFDDYIVRRNLRIDYRYAEAELLTAKKSLTDKITILKEKRIPINISRLHEYAYYLGCKEVYKKLSKQLKELDIYLKNRSRELNKKMQEKSE
ncbi:MAG: hypothetical protein MJZ34_02665 [Paludibacteraceae bacterium]|nr:hypothetical protein [Paludibacteraceae bacterium]